jgi:hypothetical protein
MLFHPKFSLERRDGRGKICKTSSSWVKSTVKGCVSDIAVTLDKVITKYWIDA